MNLLSALKAVGLAAVVAVFVAGCASAPTQEMADARQALQAARDAGATTHAPANFKSAAELLAKAEQAIEDGDFDAARADAVAAKKAAVSSRNIALAIGSAVETLDRARELGYEWRDSRKILDQARAAAEKGDETTAVKLANKAKTQGELAIDQYYLEEAKIMLDQAAAHESRMTADQKSKYRDALAAVKDADGRRAYDLASALMATLDTSAGTAADAYRVAPGDSLWGISGRTSIYDNPYYWPMIFKANAGQIKDADLIYPGQNFAIPRGYDSADVDAAVRHAKNRGAWSLGRVEASDRAYLGR